MSTADESARGALCGPARAAADRISGRCTCSMPVTLSGRQDLNLRPLDPQSSALPSCATSRHPSGAGTSLPHRRRGTSARGQALRPRFSRTRTEISIGRAGEPELLAQPALEEPPVARLEEPGGEQHERRRPGARPGWRTGSSGCLPPRTGGGVAATTSASQRLSCAGRDARVPATPAPCAAPGRACRRRGRSAPRR